MRCLLLVIMIVAAAGCAPVVDFDPAGPIDGESVNALSDTQLASRYAVAVSLNTTVRAKADGHTKSAAYRLDGIVSAQQSGNKVSLSLSMCHMGFPEVKGYKVVYAPNLISNTAPVAITGSIDAESVLQTRSAAWQLGLALADPLHDALPTDAADSHLVDVDNDGSPAASISVSGWSAFKVYLALRGIFSLRATVPPPGTAIEGTFEFVPDWAVYGDNVPFQDAKKLNDKAVADWEIAGTVGVVRMEPVAASAGCPAAAGVTP